MDDLSALFEAARESAAAKPTEIRVDPAGPSVAIRSVVPDDANESIVDLEQYNPAPYRKRGAFKFDRADSFVAYVNAHKREPGTDIFAHDTEFVAVLNGHEKDSAGWGDHRAIFTLRATPSWDAWCKADQTWMEQAEFAEFLEDRIPDVVTPDGATLLEIATTLRSKTEINFQSRVKLSNGQVQMTYEEEIQAGAGQQGNIEIPDRLTLSLHPFENVDSYTIEARFRWRVQSGKARFAYYLGEARIEVLQAVLTEVGNRIEEGIGLAVLYGTPPA